MKTFELCGLPGITLQGKKGTDGHRGNKLIFYSEASLKEDSENETNVFDYIINVVDTGLTINDYLQLGEDYEYLPGYAESLPKIKSYECLKKYIDIFENDFFLYSDKSGTSLYLITDYPYISKTTYNNDLENDTEESDSEEESEEQTNEEIDTEYKLLWRIDKWKYTNDPLQSTETTNLSIQISSIELDNFSWDGTYAIEKVSCLPKRYIVGYPNSSTGPGHHFSLLSDLDIHNALPESDIDTGLTKIVGNVYFLNNGNPISPSSTDDPVYVAAYKRRNFKDEEPYPLPMPWAGGIDARTTVNSDGSFELNITDSEFTALVVASASKYCHSVKILSQEDIENLNFNDLALYTLPFDDSTDEGNIVKNIEHIYNVYNTSKFNSGDEKIECKTITISSKLSFKESSRLRLEAEFVPKGTGEKTNIATVSSCWPNHFIYTGAPAESPYLDAHTANDYPNGIVQNMSKDFNFDSENLRTFKVVLKDFSKGNSNALYDTGIIIPGEIYNNYNMNIYAYYRINSSSIKKFLLDPAKYITTETL